MSKQVYDAAEHMMTPKKRYLMNAKESAKRLEVGCYKFSPTKAVTSRELDHILAKKMEVFEEETQRDMSDDRAQWSDRLGLLAKPLSSDVYLMCERGPDTLHAPARFFLDQLINPERPPDARSRFPFDDIAMKSSKKISRMVSVYFNLKVFSASVIQRNYRFYRFRMTSRREFALRHLMANRLQYWLKKVKWRMQRANADKAARLIKIIMAQAAMRKALARMRTTRMKRDYKMRKIVLLRYWAQKCIKRWRQHRGKSRREHGQLRKIQALVRGRAARKLKWSALLIKSRLVLWWKRVWLRKYGDRARQFLRKMRNSLLHRDVRRVQNIVRMFLARIRLARRRITIKARERHRVHGEMRALEHALLTAQVFPDVVGWDWDVFRGWDFVPGAGSVASSGKGSKRSKGSKGSKGSGKNSSRGGDGSVGSDGSSKSGGTSAPMVGTAREMQSLWKVPREYIDEFLILDEQAHRVLEGHEVGFLPPHARGALRPFFLGPSASLTERIVAATLMCFCTLPNGLIDSATMDLLVNRSTHLVSAKPTTAEAIALDRRALDKRERYLHRLGQALHNQRVEKKKVILSVRKAAAAQHNVEAVHHHHQHVSSLGALGGSSLGEKRVQAKKTKIRSRVAGSCGVQVDVMGEYYASRDRGVAASLAAQKREAALAAGLTVGHVNTPSLRRFAEDRHYHRYIKRRERAIYEHDARASARAGPHAHHTHHHDLKPITKPSDARLARAQEMARAPTLENDLCSSVWKAAPRARWQDAGSLLAVAAPSRALQLRVLVSSPTASIHLPDVLLHHATLARRWVQHTVDVLHLALESYREDNEGENQPRRVCGVCGEGFAMDDALRAHAGRGCMGRYAILDWVSPETIAPHAALLVARCGHLPSHLKGVPRRVYKTISRDKYLKTPVPSSHGSSPSSVKSGSGAGSADGNASKGARVDMSTPRSVASQITSGSEYTDSPSSPVKTEARAQGGLTADDDDVREQVDEALEYMITELVGILSH